MCFFRSHKDDDSTWMDGTFSYTSWEDRLMDRYFILCKSRFDFSSRFLTKINHVLSFWFLLVFNYFSVSFRFISRWFCSMSALLSQFVFIYVSRWVDDYSLFTEPRIHSIWECRISRVSRKSTFSWSLINSLSIKFLFWGGILLARRMDTMNIERREKWATYDEILQFCCIMNKLSTSYWAMFSLGTTRAYQVRAS